MTTTKTEPEVHDRPHGVPPLRKPDFALLREALRQGWVDFRLAPVLGLFFGLVYVLAGLAIWWITVSTGQSYWLVLAAVGFPLVGPFAAIGLYEVSHRLEAGMALNAGAILGVTWRQRGRQLPWLCVIILILFLFWFFIGHMIFALFLGLSAMTNVSSSLDIYFTSEGLMMLGVGTLVGAVFAAVLYSFSVISLPMVLDREVDFVSAMIASMSVVRDNPGVMFAWAVFLAVVVFLAMLPAFLGLLVVFPWLSHASWHIYSLMRDREEAADTGGADTGAA
ncbi:DUF2189 domain-containing protein [Aliishimia ponticola]|uniref:DUF2189 domain-containing protein n=1 Tax=Aliishimia ponticola TaxID=2499833 RepID=A0A4S4NGZ5_9RHOB|nr:DUF2189 domain-containing protein [Aliishimia ponticola]THH38932.1 DUF2189 domain-containing protein [Aliishimia ponticola]